MKRLIFTNATAQKIYDSYFKRVSRCVAILPPADQLDMQMELNSHVYEATLGVASEEEVEVLMDVLEKLGAPEEVLQPAIAGKKTRQASKTFNPRHVLQAIYLNLSNGFGYLIIGFIYLIIICFGSLIILKLLFPQNTGLFFKDGNFAFLGFSPTPSASANEIMGNWFIPFVIVIMLIAYFLNTLLLRLLKKQ